MTFNPPEEESEELLGCRLLELWLELDLALLECDELLFD